jgi:hypothetical protein
VEGVVKVVVASLEAWECLAVGVRAEAHWEVMGLAVEAGEESLGAVVVGRMRQELQGGEGEGGKGLWVTVGSHVEWGVVSGRVDGKVVLWEG